MTVWTRIFGVALLSGGMLAAAPLPQLFAATSPAPDILSGDRAEDPADSVNIGNIRPAARPDGQVGGIVAKPSLPAGNPLWAVPLSVLTATQQRPIFSASRRPPQPAVIAQPAPASPAPVLASVPDHPPLALIGSVVSGSDAIAVFLDRTNQKVVRLRQGESHAGWLLSAVQSREVMFKKAGQTEIMVLQRQNAPASGAAAVPAVGIPAVIGLPVAGVTGSYAPFIPRSTPKNGEPDGL